MRKKGDASDSESGCGSQTGSGRADLLGSSHSVSGFTQAAVKRRKYAVLRVKNPVSARGQRSEEEETLTEGTACYRAEEHR